MYVIDFETEKIEKRPEYPPKPCGLAIHHIGKKPQYMKPEHIKSALKEAAVSGEDLLFHHAKFDCAVAAEKCGVRFDPTKIHDTLPLLFLRDPHAKSFSLKPSAEAILGEAPEELDEILEWLIRNQPVPGIRLNRAKGGKNYAGSYVSYAPFELQAKYAKGDLSRAYGLFRKLMPEIKRRKMLEAYERERKLLPVLMDIERTGLRVDLRRLRKDVSLYTGAVERLDAWVCKKLKCAPFDISKRGELADRLIKAGLADETLLGLTKTGKVATSKEALDAGITDKQMLAALRYRGHIATNLQVFMRPWLEVAEKSGGLIYSTWYPTRVDGHGAGTGRFASSPNFQNLTKSPKASYFEGVRAPIEVPEAIRLRSYVIPFEGHVLIDRDYSQQEPRLLAHFCGGGLMEAYQRNPWVDYHDNAKEELKKILGMDLDRGIVKQINLGLIYGMGNGLLAEKTGLSVAEAKKVKQGILSVYPDLKDLYAEMKQRARDDEPFRTWGGREYFCEPPALIDGRLVKFDYKMPNCLIQGSASDVTKEAMIRYAAAKGRDAHMVLSVHDELVGSAPKERYKKEMEIMRECMESIKLDVPLLSEGKWSPKSWGDLQTYDKKGVKL